MSYTMRALLVVAACSSDDGFHDQPGKGKTPSVHVVGSSTLYPLSQMAASGFETDQRSVRISVTGTTKGLAELCAGRAVIAAASRPMSELEARACANNRTEVLAFPLAYDALTVVVHPANSWVDHLTFSELRRIWSQEAQGRLVNWNQIRPGFPDEPLVLFGPGRDSGTLDSFSERVVGAGGSLRRDYLSSEDDYLIVHRVASTRGALGFVGLSYAQREATALKLVAVGSSQTEAVMPSVNTLHSGLYKHLARLTFLYTSTAALARRDRKEFLEHYLKSTQTKGKSMGFVPLDPQEFASNLAQLSRVNSE
jgi:phosphate transport system substrate-binding protein